MGAIKRVENFKIKTWPTKLSVPERVSVVLDKAVLDNTVLEISDSQRISYY